MNDEKKIKLNLYKIVTLPILKLQYKILSHDQNLL